MATREKVRQFLEESDAYRHYANIVECALTYFIAKAEKEGNVRFANDLRQAQQSYHEEFRKGVEITEEVYAGTFTDDELDDLIILGGNPALKKARALTSDIFNSIVEHYALVSQ
jgi:hypothetical protein